MTALDYYDLVLAGIGASLVAGVVAGAVSSAPLHLGVLAGALFATVFVYAGLFRNPPLPETNPRVKVAAVAWHVVLLLWAAVALF